MKLKSKTIRATITPEQAKEYLSYMIVQRKVSKKKLSDIVRDLRGGHWVHNGESIKFDCTGICYDGQHRLRASVITNMSLDTEVFYSSKRASEVVSTIDTGLSRSAKDILQIDGYKNAGDVSSLMQTVYTYERSIINKTPLSARIKLTNSEISELASTNYDDYLRVANYAKKVQRNAKKQGLLFSMSSAGLLVFIGCKFNYDHELYDDFFVPLSQGVCNTDGHPALALRRALYTVQRSNYNMTHQNKTTLFIDAWNKWILNRSAIRLNPKFSNPIPKIKHITSRY